MRSVLSLIMLLTSASLAAQTQGFFLNDAGGKHADIPAFTEVSKPSATTTATVLVNFSNVIAQVSPYVYGNNANVYMTQMVDQLELLDRIKALSPNVIRFPGGNLSSVFFWDAERNQPPADAPSKLVDANGAQVDPGYWYGKNSESWTMSVDNYYEMLAATGSTGIITINYGYARYSTASDPVASAAHHAAEWVRYDNGRTKFWEIGNESNGTWQAGHRINTAANKDGQPAVITGALYGEHFRVFADSMRKAAAEVGHTIYIGAQLLAEEPAAWWNSTDRFWNNGVFTQAADVPDYYIIHSYYTPFAVNSTASEILATAQPVTIDMMEYVTEAQEEAGVTVKPLALTEWNIFAEGSKQMASYINGIHASIVLGELIKNEYGLAARWDLANGWGNGNDHGIFSQGDEPGNVPRWTPRAAYYYMMYFQRYFGNEMVETSVTGSSDVIAYGSRFTSGEAGLVLINKGTSDENVRVDMAGFGYGDRYYYHELSGGSDNGEFSLKVSVNGRNATYATGGPVNFEAIGARSALISDGVRINLPARTVVYVLVEDGDNTIVANEEGLAGFSFYPNPAKETLTLEAFGKSRVSICDLAGTERYASDFSDTHTLSTRGFAAGVYVMKVLVRGKYVVRKFVIH